MIVCLFLRDAFYHSLRLRYTRRAGAKIHVNCVRRHAYSCSLLRCPRPCILVFLQTEPTAGVKPDEAEKGAPAVRFPMRAFLAFLVPELVLLIAAVITAFGSAYLNILIPTALGSLVNVVNDMSKTGGKKSWERCIAHARVMPRNIDAGLDKEKGSRTKRSSR